MATLPIEVELRKRRAEGNVLYRLQDLCEREGNRDRAETYQKRLIVVLDRIDELEAQINGGTGNEDI
jgi:hypothetical protein